MELTGKIAIVTGANTGLGFETALDLYQKGAKVYVGCRDEQKGKEAIERICKNFYRKIYCYRKKFRLID
jgi:NAD(P)-dependent dehydrogenase (short-subunit alcohol dehydrogenase family)